MNGRSEKQLGILLLVPALLMLFAGCQTKERDQAFFNDDFPMDRRIGEIRSLGGARTESHGTHILQLDNGDTVLLRSVAINLDDEKYKSKTVEVRGVLTYTKDSKTIMEVMNIDILEQYEIKEAVKPKWVTYDGLDIGFTIKYRDDMVVRSNANGVVFEIAEEKEQAVLDMDEENYQEPEQVKHLIMVEAKAKSGSDNLVSLLELEGDGSEDFLKAGLTASRIGMDSLPAYKSESMDGAGLTFYAETSDYIYTLMFEAGADADYLQAQNFFYEMLGTFKTTQSAMGEKPLDEANNESEEKAEITSALDFDQATDTFAEGGSVLEDKEITVSAGFNVFENETFEFSIQYPKNWYYSGASSNDSDVVRRYSFGDQPADEKEGNVYLDVYKGEIPSGATAGNNDNVTVVQSGGTIEYYIEGKDRNFRLSGPALLEKTLLEMAGSLN